MALPSNQAAEQQIDHEVTKQSNHWSSGSTKKLELWIGRATGDQAQKGLSEGNTIAITRPRNPK
jgi:hypothetical protein